MRAVLQGPSGQTMLGPGTLTIGRTTDNQIVVADPKSSSHHAVVNLSPQGYSITDIGSTNGTYVNERQLDANVACLLNVGDKIRIGDTTWVYDEVNISQQVADSAPTIAAAEPYGYTEHGKSDVIAAQQPAQPSYPPAYNTSPQPLYGSSTPSSPMQPAYGSSTPSSPMQPSYGQAVPSSPMQQYGQATPSSPIQPSYMTPASPSLDQPYMPPAPFQQPYAAASMQQAYQPPPVQQPYMPPSQMPYAPPPAQQKKASGGLNKILLIVLIAVIVLGLGGGGAAWYILTRPQPIIGLTSNYKVGTTPAGSTSTVLHVTGQKFSNNSAISFLVDGKAAPGAQSVQSDANGNVKADLTITDGWTVGNHRLSAKDAGGYTPKIDQSFTIVPQGQAGTPGPNGAPSDSASFTIAANIQSQNATTGAAASPLTANLVVTGKPDPAGGAVCETTDNGQTHTSTGTGNGLTFTATIAATCSGTYKTGKVDYTETVTTLDFLYSNGVDCKIQAPLTYQQLSGTFTSATAVSGTYTANSIPLVCSLNGTSTPITAPAQKGTWTGTKTA